MATQRSDHRSSRRWLLAVGGYVLMEGPRALGGPYPEVALVYGSAPTAAARIGRPRSRARPHEQLEAAMTQMVRSEPRELGPVQLLMTAPRDAAQQFALELEQRLLAEGHAPHLVRERVLVIYGAFDPSAVNAALISPGHAQAFLRDWHTGRVRLMQLEGAGQCAEAQAEGDEQHCEALATPTN